MPGASLRLGAFAVTSNLALRPISYSPPRNDWLHFFIDSLGPEQQEQLSRIGFALVVDHAQKARSGIFPSVIL